MCEISIIKKPVKTSYLSFFPLTDINNTFYSFLSTSCILLFYEAREWPEPYETICAHSFALLLEEA